MAVEHPGRPDDALGRARGAGGVRAAVRVAAAAPGGAIVRVGRARDGASRARGPVRAVVSGSRPDGGARPDGGRALHRRRSGDLRRRCLCRAPRADPARHPRGLRRRRGLRASEPLGRRRSGDRAGDDRDTRPLQRPRRQPEHDVDAARAGGAALDLGVPRGGEARQGRRRCRVRPARRLDRGVRLARRDPRRLRGHARARPGARQPAADRRGRRLRRSRARGQRRAHAGPATGGQGSDPQPGLRRARADRPGGRAVHPAARVRDRLSRPRRRRKATSPLRDERPADRGSRARSSRRPSARSSATGSAPRSGPSSTGTTTSPPSASRTRTSRWRCSSGSSAWRSCSRSSA